MHQAWQYEHKSGKSVLVYCEDAHWRIQTKAQVGTPICYARLAAPEPYPLSQLSSKYGDKWTVYDLDRQWLDVTLRLASSIKGTCTFANGDVCEGEWKDDKRDGNRHGQGMGRRKEGRKEGKLSNCIAF